MLTRTGKKQYIVSRGGTSMGDYVHGYTERETCRLDDQAATLSDLLHHDTGYPDGSSVLEAGCGTGAQTVILTRQSPGARITSIDVSKESIRTARKRTRDQGIGNVTFHIADIYDMPFDDETFDHIFICFVLEHLHAPLDALASLKRIVRPTGTITVIEGDHGSFYCYPRSREAMATVHCLIEIQERLGGNSLIGRQLYPLLKQAGFENITVSPRMVYVDASKPRLVDGFSKKTFIAMVEGVEKQALELNLIEKETWDKGIRDLYRATDADGTFCYTFFKAVGTKVS